MELIFEFDDHLNNLPAGITYHDMVTEFDKFTESTYPLDNIQFYFYTLHRIRAINEMLPAHFNEKCSAKETVRKPSAKKDWAYGECGLANNILAVGQPNGFQIPTQQTLTGIPMPPGNAQTPI